MKKLELHAIVKGKVQGVGFRWTVVDHAEKFSLTGSVCNCSDGTVKVIAQGSKENLEAFLVLLQQDPGYAKILSIATQYRTPDRTFEKFTILRNAEAC